MRKPALEPERARRFGSPVISRLAFLLLLLLCSAAAALQAGAERGASAGLDLFSMAMGLLGGLALFLFGMEQLADGLKGLTGERLKDILGRLTTNRFMGAVTGALVTAVIQSSSVTTVLAVGFIAAGILSLSQAVGIIFGANIGTTITAQIIAFKVTHYALLLVAAGFGMLFVSSRETVRQYGTMTMGLGLVFFGMGLMSGAMKPLRDYGPFLELMARMENPFLGVGAAALFTGLVQSSSATTGVIIALASQGLITLPAGIALTFGANIGTCVTAMLAAIGKPRPAVRASLIHVLFNVTGVVLWIGFVDVLARWVVWLSPTAHGLTGVEKLAGETPRQVANAHTIFNVANALLLLPFAGQFARLVEWLLPDRPAPAPAGLAEGPDLPPVHLDPALLVVPPMALGQAREQVRSMAGVVRHMLAQIMPAFTANDTDIVDGVLQCDTHVDFLEDEITDYLVQISRLNLNQEQSAESVRLLNTTKDLEHIGDLIEQNMVHLFRKKADADIFFSEEGTAELLTYHRRVVESFDMAVAAFDQGDAQLARGVVELKAELVELEWAYRKTHYGRLSRALPESVETSQIHLELVDYLRRVDSYTESIARTVLDDPATAPPGRTAERGAD